MAKEIATTATVSIIDGYSSIEANDLDSAKLLYVALSQAETLKDNIEVPIAVKDVVVQPVQTENPETGVVEDRLLVTLITAEGKAYASNSNTVANDVRNLMVALGEPGTRFWKEPVMLKATSNKGNKGRNFISLVLA